MLGSLKVPRLWTYYHIRNSNFYNQSLISLQPFVDSAVNKVTQDTVKSLLPELIEKYGEIDNYETPELFALEESRIQQFKQKAVTLENRYSNRRIPDMKLGRMPASALIPWTIYDNSWYSIISEKNPAWCDVNFLTETTAKCLAAMRVFVMFNAPGTLKYLRSLGFQTFHGEFIDESYDDHHGNQRWDMAWQQVKRLAAADPVKVYQYYQPVLEFNAKLMETYATDELKNITNFVCNHKFLSDNFPLHVDKSFYREDKNNLLYTSPLHMENTDYFVWDPHCWWEFNVGLKRGTEFFPNAEIYRGLKPPLGAKVKELAGDSRKKIAMLFYENLYRPWSLPNKPFNPDNNEIADLHLGWADLVVVYTSEQLKNWWPIIYGEVSRQLHTDRIVLMVAGYNNYTDPDPNFIFVNHQSVLSYVSAGNAFMDVNEVTVPFRKYMFDCLIGTVKPGRLGLFYRLLDSGLASESLINLQPNPHWEPDWKVVEYLLSPGMISKHGAVMNYSSPALIDLEEDVIKDFKTRTQHGSAIERYSVNLVSRPGFDLPSNQFIMSTIVTCKIYQSIWYSIVCETVD